MMMQFHYFVFGYPVLPTWLIEHTTLPHCVLMTSVGDISWPYKTQMQMTWAQYSIPQSTCLVLMILLLFCFSFSFLRQDLTMYPRLIVNLLCSQAGPRLMILHCLHFSSARIIGISIILFCTFIFYQYYIVLSTVAL
jgi:hypothetical protein